MRQVSRLATRQCDGRRALPISSFEGKAPTKQSVARQILEGRRGAGRGYRKRTAKVSQSTFGREVK